VRWEGVVEGVVEGWVVEGGGGEGWVGRSGADAEEAERVPAAAEVVGVGEAGAGEETALAVEDGEGDEVGAGFEVRREAGVAFLRGW
jgi:hypothetical protein